MLSEKLIALRKKSSMSQQELADRICVTRQTISNWECGQGAPALDKAPRRKKKQLWIIVKLCPSTSGKSVN